MMNVQIKYLSAWVGGSAMRASPVAVVIVSVLAAASGQDEVQSTDTRADSAMAAAVRNLGREFAAALRE